MTLTPKYFHTRLMYKETKRNSMALVVKFVLWAFLSSALRTKAGETKVDSQHSCNYPAIYNFGDSNSDTGGIFAVFYPPASPAGETYFKRPAGRASDGRLIIDFIADHVGLPYLSPYLDSVASNFQHGANFATGGATVLRPNESWFQGGLSPFNLEVQVEQFTQFKDKTAYFYNQTEEECIRKRLPKPEELSRALFTVDVGQNDIALALKTSSDSELHKAAIANAVNQFVSQVRVLYERGARTFWIHNTGPIGCLPVTIVRVKDPGAGYLDENGCVKYQNGLALQYNKELKAGIDNLRSELSEAALVYVDMYSAKYELISKARDQGFEDPFEICCGYHGIGYDIWCGNKGKVNGSEVFADSCGKASKIISWDGVHYSEAANHWIANRIVNGSLSDPLLPIKKACRKQT